MCLAGQVQGHTLQLDALCSQVSRQLVGILLPRSVALHLQTHTQSVREADHPKHKMHDDAIAMNTELYHNNAECITGCTKA